MRRSFTLIELLVVVTIIAILAAMLLPVLARARGQAQRTICMNNERQVYLAIFQYAEDNEWRFPPYPGGWWEIVVRHWNWRDALKPYAGTKNVFYCPNVFDPAGDLSYIPALYQGDAMENAWGENPDDLTYWTYSRQSFKTGYFIMATKENGPNSPTYATWRQMEDAQFEWQRVMIADSARLYRGSGHASLGYGSNECSIQGDVFWVRQADTAERWPETTYYISHWW